MLFGVEMVPILPLFVLFSPAFFVLCFVTWCLFWWAMEYDSGRGATGVLAAFIVVTSLFGGMQAWHWMYDHPGKLFGVSVLGGEHWWSLGLIYDYVLLGIGWAFAHWIIFCRDDRADYEDEKKDWLDEKGIKGNKIPDDLKEEWLELL